MSETMKSRIEAAAFEQKCREGLEGDAHLLPPKRRVKVLYVHAELLLELFKRNTCDPQLFKRCVCPDVPLDAKVVSVATRSLENIGNMINVIGLVIESEEFEEIETGRLLPELRASFHLLPE